MLIPEDEQQNVLDVLWVLLSNVESKTDPKKSVLDKLEVEGAYNLLNRIKFTHHRPRWEKK